MLALSKILFIFLFLISEILTKFAKSDAINDEVVGTTYAKYVVSVRLLWAFKDYNNTHLCSGTILFPTIVVTSGHCLLNFAKGEYWPPENLMIVAGNKNTDLRDEGIQVKRVKLHKVHPMYKYPRSVGDIALLVLHSALIEDLFVKSASLNKRIPQPNWHCIVLGWGLDETKNKSAELQALGYKLLDDDKCSKGRSLEMPLSHLCAKATATSDEKTGCISDGGAPLFCNGGQLTGILSYNQCNSTDPQLFFTNSFLFNVWIHRNYVLYTSCSGEPTLLAFLLIGTLFGTWFL